MKSNTLASNEVIVSGAKQSGNFTIAANGKAFKILIDGLYSNKIQAIVRELSSNAFDSHAAAGRSDMPFDLHLPNLLDPTFIVRDYGTSLSHENVMGLYTTVFQSTKEDTNLAIGKFGLGSKTPFAYTDSFTVTAFMRGTKRVYGAYIDVTGIPMISLMASEDTAELDGLMVSFPVNIKDCERFRAEAERVLSGFDVKPNVKGGEVKPTIYESVYEGSNFKILDSKTGPLARQGCVIYPIDLNALPDLSPDHLNILKSNILIDFPIGQVDITPSRESLSYDDTTIKNILDMAIKIDAEIKKSLAAEVKKARVLHDVQVLFCKFKDMGLKSAKAFANAMTWNDKPISTSYYISRDKLLKSHGFLIDGFDKNYYEDRKTFRFKYDKYNLNWDVTANTAFIYEPSGSVKASTKIKELTLNRPDIDNVVWIKQEDPKVPVDRRKLLQLIGYAPIIDVNDLVIPDKPRRQRAAPITREQIRVKRLDHVNSKLEEILDVEGADYLYIVEEERGYYKSNVRINTSDLFKFLNFLNIDKTTIKIIARRQLDKVSKYSNWKPVMCWANYDKLEAVAPFKEYYTNESLQRYKNHWLNKYNGLINKNYDNETPWKKVLDILGKINYEKTAIDASLIWLYRDIVGHSRFNEVTEPHKIIVPTEETLNGAYNNLFESYPMLKHVDEPGWRDDGTETIKDIENYIKLVDESNML